MKEEKNKNGLFRSVDLVVAYLIIFSFALAIVFFMVNFLDNKVQDITKVAVDVNTK